MSFSTRPRLALIAAVAANGVMGRNGGMPWHLSPDLKRFKALTTGKRMVMGRRTWEAFPKPLPEREHIVVTSTVLVLPAGVTAVRSLTEALALPGPTDPVFVIGGSGLYREAMAIVDDIYLTEIAADVEGDTHFPDWDRAAFREVSREPARAPLQAGGPEVDFAFVKYERK